MIRRNIFFRLLEATASVIFGITQLTLLTKTFPPKIVGEWYLITTLLFFVAALSANWGIVWVASRNINQGEAARSSLWTAFFVQLGVVLILLPIISLVGFESSYFESTRIPFILLSGTYLVSTLPQVSELLLIARKEMPRIAVMRILGFIITTLFMLIAVRRNDLTLAFVGLGVGYIFNASLTFFLSRAGTCLPFIVPSKKRAQALFREAIPMVVMSVMTGLYVRVDVVMIDWFFGKAEVGYYATTYSVLDHLMTLAGAIMSALIPHFSETAHLESRAFKALFRKSLLFYVIYFFPIAAVIAMGAPFLLSTFFGAEYVVGSASLRILMLAAVFAWLNGASGTILISLRRQHIYMIGTCLSLLVNVVGNLILLPRIGILGAAWSTVLTEAMLCTFSFIVIRREIGYIPFFDQLPREES